MSEKKLTFPHRAGLMTAAALDLRNACEVLQQVLSTVEKEAEAMQAAAERFAASGAGRRSDRGGTAGRQMPTGQELKGDLHWAQAYQET